MSTFGSDAGHSFLDYARMQHERGVELASRHVAESTGCCRACGRVFPCDGFVDGQYMQAHYLSYLPELASTHPASTNPAATDLPATDSTPTTSKKSWPNRTPLATTSWKLWPAAGAIRSAEQPMPHRVFVSAFNRMA